MAGEMGLPCPESTTSSSSKWHQMKHQKISSLNDFRHRSPSFSWGEKKCPPDFQTHTQVAFLKKGLKLSNIFKIHVFFEVCDVFRFNTHVFFLQEKGAKTAIEKLLIYQDLRYIR